MTLEVTKNEDQQKRDRRHQIALAYLTAIGGLIAALAAVLALVLR
jgi:hypothetical protein